MTTEQRLELKYQAEIVLGRYKYSPQYLCNICQYFGFYDLYKIIQTSAINYNNLIGDKSKYLDASIVSSKKDKYIIRIIFMEELIKVLSKPI